MNTKDIQLKVDELPWAGVGGTELEVNRGDILATMFAGQLQLMEKYDPMEARNGAVVIAAENRGELDRRDVQIRLKDLAYRVIEELSEATNTLKNKPWKQSFVATDGDHFREECADAVHFFIEFLITAGFTPTDVFRIYFRKHAVNEFRQESKY